MLYSEAVELLVAAKLLIDQIKLNPPGYSFSKADQQALVDIEKVLKDFDYSETLLQDAGWTKADLLFLIKRLLSYHSGTSEL